MLSDKLVFVTVTQSHQFEMYTQLMLCLYLYIYDRASNHKYAKLYDRKMWRKYSQVHQCLDR